VAKKIANKDQVKKSDIEKAGRLLYDIAEFGGSQHKKIYRTAFVKGLFQGLGGVIGATIIVALMLLILSLLGEVPFVGPVAETVENTLNNR
jgi:hypothetical protein